MLRSLVGSEMCIRDRDDGVSTEMIKYLCEKYKISMYAFDGKQKCFEKNVFSKSNYRPVAYYCIDGHMYLITDSKYIPPQRWCNDLRHNIGPLGRASPHTNSKAFF